MAPVGVEHDGLVGLRDRIQKQRNRLRETELELEEAEEPTAMSRVHTPSKDEYERHYRTHLPDRNWCPICVRSKRRNNSHAQHGKNKNEEFL